METKGIIISQKEYERLTDLEKNFNDKVKENKETFKKGLEDAIKGNLVKLLWVKDKCYAEIMGCDLSEDGVCNFIRKEDADMLDSTNSKVSYDRNNVFIDNNNVLKDNNNVLKDNTKIIVSQKKSIRNPWLAFGIMCIAWLVLLIAYIMK